MDPIERMMAERACEQLQVAYSRAADRGDADGFAALFAEDASIVIPEYPPFTGHAAIHASLVALAATGRAMLHVVTNQHVRLTAADAAEGGCYLIVYDSAEPADANGIRPLRPPATIGEYIDRFRLTAHGWRFQERRLKRTFRPAPQAAGPDMLD